MISQDLALKENHWYSRDLFSTSRTSQDKDHPFPFRNNPCPRIILCPQGFSQLKDRPSLRDHSSSGVSSARDPPSSGITLFPQGSPAQGSPSVLRGSPSSGITPRSGITPVQGLPQLRGQLCPGIPLCPQGFPEPRDHFVPSSAPRTWGPGGRRPSPPPLPGPRATPALSVLAPGSPRPLTAEPHRGRRRRGTGRCGTGRCGTARRGAGSAPAPPARRGPAAPAAAAPSPCGASARREPTGNGGDRRPRGRDCRGACAGRGAGSELGDRLQARGGKRASGAG